MRYLCPVCMFRALPYPPEDYNICPCCGTEFGNDDDRFAHQQLRKMWVGSGAHWFFGRAPERWNPWLQLIDGGHPEAVPGWKFAVGNNGVSSSEITIMGDRGVKIQLQTLA